MMMTDEDEEDNDDGDDITSTLNSMGNFQRQDKWQTNTFLSSKMMRLIRV